MHVLMWFDLDIALVVILLGSLNFDIIQIIVWILFYLYLYTGINITLDSFVKVAGEYFYVHFEQKLLYFLRGILDHLAVLLLLVHSEF